MTLLQLLMLGASAYFAVKIYEHINTLKDETIQGSNLNENKAPKNGLNNQSVVQLVTQADEAFQQEHFEEAVTLLEEANTKKVEDDEILFKLGFLYQKLEERERAFHYYKEALELDRDNEYIYNALASLYRESGEYGSAEIQLKASLERNSNNAKTYFNYGNLLVDMNKIDQAKEMYAKALELESDFKEAQQELEKLEMEHIG